MADQSAVEAWLTWAFAPSLSVIIVTVLICILSPVILHHFLYRKAASKELPSFLLLGPSGAGKTSLLTLLANGVASPTQTSQEPQAAECRLPPSVRSFEDRYRSDNDVSSTSQPPLIVVDTPGHGKLRHHAVASLASRPSLRGLVFVVDSAAVSSTTGLTEAAEYLHDILLLLQHRHTRAKTSRDPAALPVLIAANKQDVFTSLPPAMVKTKLEQEIARVRLTKSRGLLDSGIGHEDDAAGADEERNWLGEYGAKEFRFAQMEEHGVQVTVVGGNVKGDGEDTGNVQEWWAWIGEQL